MSNILQYLKNALHTSAKAVCIIFFLSISERSFSQKQDFDEISVTVNVPRIGSWEMTGIIKGQEVYLPVKDLFDVLQLKNNPSSDGDSISGFFISPGAKYLFDKSNNRITYQNKNFDLTKTDLLFLDNSLFLRSNFYGEIFGLDCIFNFRSLSVTINTKLELPAIREMQLQQMRKNITQLKGERKADTTIKRHFSLFHLGTADWAIINYKQPVGGNYTRVTANLGAVIAGGEANVFLNYNSNQPLDPKDQYYRWRFVNNDNNVLRQVTAGNLFVPTTVSIYGALNGIQISNTPTTYRRSFGTYRIADKTEPGGMIELYVNDILISYTKADASGYYTFDVPLVYGATNVKLRFYGPWGEERTSEQSINIPFNFLPVHQFEYNLSAGVVEDDSKSKFSRLSLNYGLNSRITIGSGVEYLSSLYTGKIMPYINTSVRLGANILISSEYTHGVRSRTVASYRLPAGLQFEVNYIKYVPGQMAFKSGKASSANYLEDKKAILFYPFRSKKFAGFSRLSVSQLTVPKLKYTTAELLLSGMYKGINTNITTSAVYSDPKHPLVYSNIATTFRLAKGIRLTTQGQYEYSSNSLSMVKGEVEKNLWNKGFMLLTYEKNLTYKHDNISLGIRYNFSFAQTFLSVTKSNDATTMIQSARGSILYNDKSNKISLSNQSNVGRGGLLIVPFLDMNCNGVQDKGEPKAEGLKLKINGGRVLHNKKDTSISITGLEAYSNYYVELDKNSFDNIGWVITKPAMNIVIEPNNFRLIKVPVAVVGEATGTVFSSDKNEVKGIGRIIINFYDKNSQLAGHILTESDGYFSYVGLKPGSYTVEIDKSQLQKIGMTAFPSMLPINIKSTREGDTVEDLKFVLKPLKITEEK